MKIAVEGNPFEETAQLLTGGADYARIDLARVAADSGVGIDTLERAIYVGTYPGPDAEDALAAFNAMIRTQIEAGGNTQQWLAGEHKEKPTIKRERKATVRQPKKVKPAKAGGILVEPPPTTVRQAEPRGVGFDYPRVDMDMVAIEQGEPVQLEEDGVEIIRGGNRASLNVAAWTHGIESQAQKDVESLTVETLKKRLLMRGVDRRWIDDSPVLSKALQKHTDASHPQIDVAVANGTLPGEHTLGIAPLRLVRILHGYSPETPLEARLEEGEMDKLKAFCAQPGRFSAKDSAITRY